MPNLDQLTNTTIRYMPETKRMLVTIQESSKVTELYLKSRKQLETLHGCLLHLKFPLFSKHLSAQEGRSDKNTPQRKEVRE